MQPFDFELSTRIVFGPGRVEQLGQIAAELGAKRALVVSDPGVVAVGHVERASAALAAAGLATRLFDGVEENPTTKCVDAGVVVAKEFQPDLIIGLGGGSSMDAAKGINFIHTGGGRMHDYWGRGKARGPMLPSIAVPTTAGTGSETQSYALISDAETHVKMACGDKRAAFRVALLDPVLTITQPARVTALTGIDAIAHAVESLVSTAHNTLSQAYSREAWRLLSGSFLQATRQPEDLNARSAMQLGASLAGLAIENSMLGAAHALANPLTARFGVTHGQAVSLMLPHVVKFNAPVVGDLYQSLLSMVDATTPGGTGEEAAARLAGLLTEMASAANLELRLRDVGVDRESLSQLAAEASKQWTATFNPRTVEEADLLSLYQQAW